MLVSTPVAPAVPAAAPTRDVQAVTGALNSLDQAVAAAERAAAIQLPSKGVFGGGKDAYEAAVAQRRELLAPAATAIRGVVELLNANAGYASQPRDQYGRGIAYSPPIVGLGDDAEDIVTISGRAAENPVKHKWANDMPWQSQPTTTLEEMVGYMRAMAEAITRGEARISVAKVTEATADVLYEQRAEQLDPGQLERLQTTVGAVRSLGSSRFADDDMRKALDALPAEVVGADGRLTTDPSSLAALEQLHRSTVVDTGATRASENVEQLLARAKELVASGDTDAARAIYEQLAGTSSR